MEQTARWVVIDALLHVAENEGYSNIVIDKALRGVQLEKRDRALASTIFYGVLEKQITLDYFIQLCLTDPEKKRSETIDAILRSAAYQILYLDRIPDSAAVNEAVNLTKAFGKGGQAGFVNGVLRTLLRKKEALQIPNGTDSKSLSVRYSVPSELIEFWHKSYGPEPTDKLLESLTKRPALYVRINPLQTSLEEMSLELAKEEMELTPCEYPSGAAILTNCGAPQDLSGFAEGKFHVQDLSAQMICDFLDVRPGEIVCDCCAAPGGKSFTLAENMRNQGKVISLDLYKGRVNLIRQGAKRLGLTIIDAFMNDALKGFDKLEPVDRMLCDVPCSGYGVIRRKPEIRYKSLSSIEDLPAIQYQILKNASAAVKPGGTLLYSTCTLNPRENGEVAGRFLRESADYEPLELVLPQGVSRVIKEPSHTLTMMPFAGASDGFYVAVFHRKNL